MTKLLPPIIIVCILFSCQKDESDLLSKQKTYINDLTASFKNHLIKEQMNLNLAELKVERDELLNQLKSNKKLLESKSANHISLSSLFYLHMGTLNSLYGDTINPSDDYVIHEYQTDVPIFSLGVDSFGIEIEDYNLFLSEIEQNMAGHVQNGEYLTLLLLEPAAISPPTVSINVTLYMAVRFTSSMTPIPTHSWYYTGKFEDCATGQTLNGTYDAADVLDGYLKSYASQARQCQTGTTHLIGSVGNQVFQTYGNGRPLGLDRWDYTPIVTLFHHAQFPQCIGDDNDPVLNDQEWDQMFNDAVTLFNSGFQADPGQPAGFIKIWDSPIITSRNVVTTGINTVYRDSMGTPVYTFNNAHRGRVVYYYKTCL